ncbi:MAG TPA: hypothetical protein VNJ52_05200 [Patescibacteria group bacterium]|nr:hypothetical protein [Patescibacteria group bacterium]
MRIHYQYAHAPLLKNRETIQVKALITVESKYDCEPEVSALADSAVNRWALTLQNAAQSLSEETYESVAKWLSYIWSQNFTIIGVIVTSILPLLEHPPKREPEPTPTRLETIKQALRERTDTAQGFLEAVRESKQEYPEIWTHTDYAQSLETFIKHTIRSTFGKVENMRNVNWTIT